MFDEKIDDTAEYELFDPDHTWKRKTITDFIAKPLLKPVFIKGKFVGQNYTATEIKNYCEEQVALLWDEVRRFENPHGYYVDYSQRLWDVKNNLLNSHTKK